MGFEISFGHGARIVENCGPTTPHLVEFDINGHFLTFSKRTLNLFLINIYYIILYILFHRVSLLFEEISYYLRISCSPVLHTETTYPRILCHNTDRSCLSSRSECLVCAYLGPPEVKTLLIQVSDNILT